MGKRILITGFSGFVSRHFVDYLRDEKVESEVLGIDINQPKFDYHDMGEKLSVDFETVNLLDYDQLYSVMKNFAPDYILHLASYSSVAYSWKHPKESFRNNTNIFLNMATAINKINVDCRILSVGSSEEYGNVSEEDVPLKEDRVLNPNSPYAVARVSQEMLAKLFSDNYHMNIVLTRSFNHIGPYQDERFVVPSFIRRILDIRNAGNKVGVIETGDTSIVRDFVDVRDVVRAYYLLLHNGVQGQMYNVCSGRGVSLQQIIEIISRYLDMEIDTKVNREYVRPSDNRIMIGSAEKIKMELGWSPRIKLEDSLIDMIENMKNIGIGRG
jgi:GDP-4-dehydro-6-deoxy-D-mannose reductase